MNSAPEPPHDDEHCCDTHLIFSAAKLDVYRHERLANTEPPQTTPARPVSKRTAALLRAMASWALSHF
jgi:hypothetical protein